MNNLHIDLKTIKFLSTKRLLTISKRIIDFIEANDTTFIKYHTLEELAKILGFDNRFQVDEVLTVLENNNYIERKIFSSHKRLTVKRFFKPLYNLITHTQDITTADESINTKGEVK